jgi:hypothetical protein
MVVAVLVTRQRRRQGFGSSGVPQLLGSVAGLADRSQSGQSVGRFVIARASMTVHIVADAVGPSSSHTLGFLRMSAANARAFLTDLRNGHSPIVATGDEDGTVQIEFESTGAGTVLLVRKPGERHALHRWVIDQRLDLKTTATELLADLGA